MKTTTKKQPIHKVKRGTTQVAIWQNTTRDGKEFHSMSLEHSYKDQKGNWQIERISLFIDEALKVAHALIKANQDYYELPQFSKSSKAHEEADQVA